VDGGEGGGDGLDVRMYAGCTLAVWLDWVATKRLATGEDWGCGDGDFLRYTVVLVDDDALSFPGPVTLPAIV